MAVSMITESRGGVVEMTPEMAGAARRLDRQAAMFEFGMRLAAEREERFWRLFMAGDKKADHLTSLDRG